MAPRTGVRNGLSATRPRLLIVDDDELACRSLARAFRRTVDVSTADNASAARSLLSTHAFDVVLSDFEMPGENGLQLLSSIASQFPLVRRVLMTAEAMQLNAQLEDGTVHAKLTKPFDVDEASRVLGLTSMRMAALGNLRGAFVTSLDDLPIAQVVLHVAPSEAEVRAFVSWQQRLLDTGTRHAVLLIIEPKTGVPLSRIGGISKWLMPLRSQDSSLRTSVAVVASTRLERMAMSAANLVPHWWPVKVFAPDDLNEGVRWLRSL